MSPYQTHPQHQTKVSMTADISKNDDPSNHVLLSFFFNSKLIFLKMRNLVTLQFYVSLICFELFLTNTGADENTRCQVQN